MWFGTKSQYEQVEDDVSKQVRQLETLCESDVETAYQQWNKLYVEWSRMPDTRVSKIDKAFSLLFITCAHYEELSKVQQQIVAKAKTDCEEEVRNNRKKRGQKNGKNSSEKRAGISKKIIGAQSDLKTLEQTHVEPGLDIIERLTSYLVGHIFIAIANSGVDDLRIYRLIKAVTQSSACVIGLKREELNSFKKILVEHSYVLPHLSTVDKQQLLALGINFHYIQTLDLVAGRGNVKLDVGKPTLHPLLPVLLRYYDACAVPLIAIYSACTLFVKTMLAHASHVPSSLELMVTYAPDQVVCKWIILLCLLDSSQKDGASNNIIRLAVWVMCFSLISLYHTACGDKPGMISCEEISFFRPDKIVCSVFGVAFSSTIFELMRGFARSDSTVFVALPLVFLVGTFIASVISTQKPNYAELLTLLTLITPTYLLNAYSLLYANQLEQSFKAYQVKGVLFPERLRSTDSELSLMGLGMGLYFFFLGHTLKLFLSDRGVLARAPYFFGPCLGWLLSPAVIYCLAVGSRGHVKKAEAVCVVPLGPKP